MGSMQGQAQEAGNWEKVAGAQKKRSKQRNLYMDIVTGAVGALLESPWPSPLPRMPTLQLQDKHSHLFD